MVVVFGELFNPGLFNMQFSINISQENILTIIRRLGYHPHGKNKSFARRLGNSEFPRFHLYIDQISKFYKFSLHLDQKGACYKDQVAHSGEYDGTVLEDEKARIINLLKN